MTPLAATIQSLLLRELSTLALEIEAYPDEAMIWSLPEGLPNSGGTLTLHLTGNLQHYIGHLLGGSGYVRDREFEFSARGLSRKRLLSEIRAAADAVGSTLPALSEDQLHQDFSEPLRGYVLETGEFLMALAVHLGYHLGQISYHRRLISGNATGVGALPPEGLSTARPAAAEG